MDLFIYIATHLHTVYLDWLQVVLESNWRCAGKWQSSELRDTLWGNDRGRLVMHSEIVIEQVSWCTWRPWSCELGGRNQATLEIHLQAMMEPVGRCTWRPWSSKFGDMYLEAMIMRTWRPRSSSVQVVIERVWRCIWRPRSNDCGGHNRASLETHLEAVIELVWSCTWRPWSCALGRVLGGSRGTGAPGAETVFICKLTCNRGTVTRWLYLWVLMETLFDGSRWCREARRKLKLCSVVNS